MRLSIKPIALMVATPTATEFQSMPAALVAGVAIVKESRNVGACGVL